MTALGAVDVPPPGQPVRRPAGAADAARPDDTRDGRPPPLLEVEGDSTEWVVMTEAELATMRAEEGERVHRCRGRSWRSTHAGFYQPVHMLSRVNAGGACRPSPFCWGYRVGLTETDAGQANATIPLYLLADVDGFAQGLSRNRRGDLRKCRRFVELRVVSEPSLLLEQGHKVFLSATEGRSYCRRLSEVEYLQGIRRSFSHKRTRIVAGLIDGQLAGYMVSFAVEGILYLEHVFVCAEARRTGIGTGLYVATIESALRSGRIHVVCNSFHTPEVPTICRFKESLGFEVVRVPARLAAPAPVLAVVRRRQPAVYYRLTGQLPRSLEVPSP